MIAARILATPEQAAHYLGIPEPVLRRWRRRRIGPRPCRVDRQIRYQWTDLDKWIHDHQ